MERKEISFKSGIRRSPSMALESGELSECVNLIPRNGELVNIKPPVAYKKSDDTVLSDTGKLVYVHNTDGVDRFIFLSGNNLTYKTGNSAGTVGAISDFKGVTSLGKFLVVTGDEVYYFYWDSSASSYTSLSGLPNIRCDFSLAGTFKRKVYSDGVTMAKITGGNAGAEYTNEIASVSWPLTHTYQHCTISKEGLISRGLSDKELYSVYNPGPHVIKIHTLNGLSDGSEIKVGERSKVCFVNGDIELAIQNSSVVSGETVSVVLCTSVNGSLTDCEYVVRNTDENLQAMFGAVTQFEREIENSEKKFVRPFFVRYGLRLYDGSVVRQSAPILMVPNWGVYPLITTASLSTSETEKVPLQLAAFSTDLKVVITKDSNLSTWKDIVKGLVISVSEPIERYDKGHTHNQSINETEVWGYDASNPDLRLSGNYSYLSGGKKMIYGAGGFGSLQAKCIVRPPYTSDQEFSRQIARVSNFYVLKEYTLDEVIASSGTIKIDTDLLVSSTANVASLVSMTDDNNSHRTIIPEKVFSYNGRVNFANICSTYNPINNEVSGGVCASYYDGERNLDSEYRIATYVKKSGKEVIVDSGWLSGFVYGHYFYYPDAGASKAVLYWRYKEDRGTGEQWYYCKANIALKAHGLLSGAYYFSRNAVEYTVCAAPAESEFTKDGNVITDPCDIATSKVNNPFTFLAENISRVGLGCILTISTSAKAISSGTQFGTFPLYAFCSDGIWPLQVNGDGTFDAPQPLSRDVVSNPDAVCQIDQAVIYPTNSGLKVLQAENSGIISESLRGHNIDESYFFSDLSDGFDRLAVKDTKSIVEIVNDSYILYDYANSLLHVYPKTPSSATISGNVYCMHYVFSLDQKEWSTVVDMDSNVKAVVPGYPYGYVQLSTSGNILRFTDEEDNTTLRKGLILTRPVSFDDPIGMKALCDFQTICGPGGYAQGIVQPFVSNDGKSWYKLTSLRSRAFKWFRFRIRALLTDLDALTGMICDVDPRRQNKLR